MKKRKGRGLGDVLHTAHWKNRCWERREDGYWYDCKTATRDPLAEDMTISNFYNFRVVQLGPKDKYVEVPIGLALEEPDLSWVLKYRGTFRYGRPGIPIGVPDEDRWKKHRDPVDYNGKGIILVPINAWDFMDERIGVIGIWHPEIR